MAGGYIKNRRKIKKVQKEKTPASGKRPHLTNLTLTIIHLGNKGKAGFEVLKVPKADLIIR
ncbi:MAG: hypothetical protein LPK14_01485 [Hymenobacteraceae bacterium]|nr:hypothetical protein [Hymenobacteraceae bacterium]